MKVTQKLSTLILMALTDFKRRGCMTTKSNTMSKVQIEKDVCNLIDSDDLPSHYIENREFTKMCQRLTDSRVRFDLAVWEDYETWKEANLNKLYRFRLYLSEQLTYLDLINVVKVCEEHTCWSQTPIKVKDVSQVRLYSLIDVMIDGGSREINNLKHDVTDLVTSHLQLEVTGDLIKEAVRNYNETIEFKAAALYLIKELNQQNTGYLKSVFNEGELGHYIKSLRTDDINHVEGVDKLNEKVEGLKFQDWFLPIQFWLNNL